MLLDNDACNIDFDWLIFQNAEQNNYFRATFQNQPRIASQWN